MYINYYSLLKSAWQPEFAKNSLYQLEVIFNVMRSINPRFTYLLIYLCVADVFG